MEQTIVDIPERKTHNKYNLQQLVELPAGKALRTVLSNATEARTARGSAWLFCKRRNLKCSTHTVRNNGNYIMYTWLI